MQVTPLGTRRLGTGEAGETSASKAASSVTGSRESATRATKATGAQALRSSGVRNWDPKLNEQISGAQRALRFLDRMGAMLESLKNDISGKLAARQTGDAGLDEKLQQVSALWQERRRLAGGSLDGKLAYSGTEQARQSFSIRGFDVRALQPGAREKLDFSVGTAGQRVMTAIIDPGLTQDEIIQRINQALASADIRVERSERGMLGFSVPESVWPQVRDTLAVKGGGIRFPGGQMHRAAVEAAPDALRPDTWGTGDAFALRRTLQEVIDVIDRIRDVKQAVQRALADIQGRVGDTAASGKEKEWAESFAENFEAMSRRPSYHLFFAIAPALASISRPRVLSLLSIK